MIYFYDWAICIGGFRGCLLSPSVSPLPVAVSGGCSQCPSSHHWPRRQAPTHSRGRTPLEKDLTIESHCSRQWLLYFNLFLAETVAVSEKVNLQPRFSVPLVILCVFCQIMLYQGFPSFLAMNKVLASTFKADVILQMSISVISFLPVNIALNCCLVYPALSATAYCFNPRSLMILLIFGTTTVFKFFPPFIKFL